MTANGALLWFVVLFWLVLWLGTKVERLCRGMSFRGGPSFIPLIPFLPMIAIGAGWLVNLRLSPWGTVAVAVLHVGWVIYALVGIWLHPSRS